MDIALCAIDIENNLINYAGANRPLWLLRKDETSIVEIKATKKAIGGLNDDGKLFLDNTLEFKKGDSIYLFTDGYADQFGGVDSKKLMAKNVKEILLNIQHKSMKMQGEYLEKYIDEWKGASKQIDDMLAIGIKL